MKKKLGIFSFICLMTILLLSACGNSNDTSADDSSKTTIKYWSMWNKGEPQQELLQQIIKDYEKANSDVTVDVQWMGREVLSDVRNALQSGDAPDLTDQSGTEVTGTLIKNDMAEPLDGLLSKDIPDEGAFKDAYKDGILSFYQHDDKTYYIPYELITSAFSYNKKLFADNNIEPPKTWDDFIAVSKKLKDKGIAPLAEDGNIDFYNAYYYYWLAERIMGNGSLLKAAGDKSGDTWSEPGYLEAAEKVQELVDSGFFADGYQGSQYPAGQTAWAKGDAAMILNGSWISSETNKYAADDFEYAAFPFPAVDGNEFDNEAELYLEGWVAPKGANVDAVEDFIAFAMQKKYQEGITKTGNMSPRNDVDAPENLVDFEKIIEDADNFHPEYDGLQAEYPDWWKTVFTPTDDKLIFGKIDAKEFIKDMQKKTKEFWANK